MTRDPFEELFRREAPPVDDPAVTRRALDAYTPGFERAHRRRRAGIAGTVAALGLLIAVGIGVTFAGSEADTSTDFADDGSDAAPDLVDPDVDPAPDALDDAGPDESANPEATPTTGPPTSTLPPGQAEATTSSTTTTTTTVTVTGSADTTTTTTVDGTPPVVGSSTGGSATVGIVDGALTLVEVNPAPGYTFEVREQTPEKIKIRFDGPSEHELQFELEHGSIVVEDENEDDEGS